MSPFRNILRLTAGDFAAKTVNFLTFLYLARTLGVDRFGILEFAVSSLMYFSLLADVGLELWGTRQAAQGADRIRLVARIVPLRLLLASLSALLLMLLLPLFPDFALLRRVMMLFALTLFAQAVSLKWVFLGQERMARVAAGLLAAQVVFTVAILALVRGPAGIVWVPVARLAGELAMSGYYLVLFRSEHGRVRLSFDLTGAREVLLPALWLGTSSGLAMMSYNVDSVLLGFLLGPTAVGLYAAAYKPVTVALAMPVTYFMGLLPVLSRTYASSRREYHEMVSRSVHIAALVAPPLGVGGALLAEPIVGLLFGASYLGSVPALRILAWSATLVVLRGTYKQALYAAGRSRLELGCAGAATALNVALNLALIPTFGIEGAAAATLASELAWLAMLVGSFNRALFPLGLVRSLLRPGLAAAAMAACLWLGWPQFWILRALCSLLVYVTVLALVGHPEIRSRLDRWRARSSVAPAGADR